MKCRNLSRWIDSRLRRLTAKVASGRQWTAEGFTPVPAPELARCRARASQLLNLSYP